MGEEFTPLQFMYDDAELLIFVGELEVYKTVPLNATVQQSDNHFTISD